MTELHIYPISGLPEFSFGANIAASILDCIRSGEMACHDGDILVIASKIVAKAEGRAVSLGENLRKSQLVAQHSRRIVAHRMMPNGDVTAVVEANAGPIMAAAGIDTSNVGPRTVLTLPEDSDATARRIRSEVSAALGRNIGVIISDSGGRPWRYGVSDFALGCSGILALEDLRSQPDTHGQRMQVSVRAIADQLSAAADLVKGKLGGTPVALVRGAGQYVITGKDASARSGRDLCRSDDTDWFSHGSTEATLCALGIGMDAQIPLPLDHPPHGLATDQVQYLQWVIANAATTLGSDTPWHMSARAGTVKPTITLSHNATSETAQPDLDTYKQWAQLTMLLQGIFRAGLLASAKSLPLEVVSPQFDGLQTVMPAR